MPAKKTRKPSPTTTPGPVRPITTAPHQPKNVRGKTAVHPQYVLTLSKVENKKRKLFGGSSKDDASDLFPSGSSGRSSGLVPLLFAPILLCVMLYGFVAIGTKLTTSGQIPKPSLVHNTFCIVLDIAQTFGIDVDDEQKAARCQGGLIPQQPPT